MVKIFGIAALFAAFAMVSAVHATILPFPSPLPRVTAPFDSILLKTWNGIKKRNIDPYAIKLVHRPKSETPGDAVSEGVGYGMLLALYCNDQPTFNKLWDEAESRMWQGEFYNWRLDKNGVVVGLGAASDADEDIALALIFADALVKKNHWQQHSSPKGATYAARAQAIISSIWKNMVASGRYLDPGSPWSYGAFVNPSYFAPASYRVFDEFETTHHDWKSVIDQCYATLKASPGYANGLIPDWMTPDGKYVTGAALGYNAYAEGKSMYKDGIRCLWRIATDYLWYNDPRAEEYLSNAFKFLRTPDRANFYQMDGTLIPGADTFSLGNGAKRFRREHSHLTLGMWAPLALCCGTGAQADTFSNALLGFYTPGADYWGKAVDTAGTEDTLHNEMYFDQFLSWFGAALMGGVFTNIWEDFKDPDPGLALSWKMPPSADTDVVDASVKPLRVRGLLNKRVAWTVSFIFADSGRTQYSVSRTSDTLDCSWSGISTDGKAAPAGRYQVKITAKGLDTPFFLSIWLGRVAALETSEGLLVDDFRDGDLKPFIGAAWQSYLDSYEGKAGQSSVPRFAVVPGAPDALAWEYLLKQGNLGFNGYAALEWNAGAYPAEKSYAGLQSIVIVAKTAKADSFSLQLVTSDIPDYNFFEDSLCTTTDWKTYVFPMSGFKRRFGGSGSPTPGKLTAIRLQKQGRDGSQNTLSIQKVFFKGTLANIYQNPPAFIPPDSSFFPKAKSSRIAFPRSASWIRFTGGSRIILSSPDRKSGFTFTIATLRGQTVLVKKSAAPSMEAAISGLGDGMYLVVMKCGGRSYCRRIAVTR